MSDFIKVVIKEKEYLLGYPNRKSVARCEEITNLKLGKIEENLISSGDKIFWGGLLEKQPDITEEKAYELIDDLLKEDNYSYQEIYEFLVTQIIEKTGFRQSTKKHQALQIVKM